MAIDSSNNGRWASPFKKFIRFKLNKGIPSVNI
jgi:hypothetical protein